MRDEAHEWTDEQIAALVERIRLTYRSAQIDVQGKLDQFIRKFKRDETKFREKLEKGEITQENLPRLAGGAGISGEALAHDAFHADRHADQRRRAGGADCQ